MNEVRGIYNQEDFDKLTNFLDKHEPLVGLFWRVACDTGFRVSDILRLRVHQLTDGLMTLTESKTGKERGGRLSHSTLYAVCDYVADKKLLQSDIMFPITRQKVWRVIKNAGDAVGIPCLSLGHILRARHLPGVSWPLTRRLRHSKTS